MAGCLGAFQIQNERGATTGVDLTVPRSTVALVVRVVDATGAPVAWELARVDVPGEPFHFSAGESWEVDRMQLADDLYVRVTSAAGTTIEVQLWQAA